MRVKEGCYIITKDLIKQEYIILVNIYRSKGKELKYKNQILTVIRGRDLQYNTKGRRLQSTYNNGQIT